MVEEITADVLHSRLGDEDVRILDVREPVEFEAGHIPGSVNVPIGDLTDGLSAFDWDLNRVVVVCQVGALSVQAGRLIEAYEEVGDDVRVASLAGGYADWPYEVTEGAGRPLGKPE
ncbi:MAG: rhodanese-like domain-containing protein [Halodesulfurarchaeum sp.]